LFCCRRQASPPCAEPHAVPRLAHRHPHRKPPPPASATSTGTRPSGRFRFTDSPSTFHVMYSLLYLIPKNWVSRAVGRVMEARGPFGLNVLIRNAMIRAFKPEVAEAEHPLEHYRTWSEFFVRRLKPGARPVGTSPLVCPVDGTLTQRGYLESPELLLTQIKGIRYSLQDLLAGWDTTPYQGGSFMTVYLAPYNYHRIHAPAGGQLRRALHVPGALWPVNAWSVRSIRGLFV